MKPQREDTNNYSVFIFAQALINALENTGNQILDIENLSKYSSFLRALSSESELFSLQRNFGEMAMASLLLFSKTFDLGITRSMLLQLELPWSWSIKSFTSAKKRLNEIIQELEDLLPWSRMTLPELHRSFPKEMKALSRKKILENPVFMLRFRAWKNGKNNESTVSKDELMQALDVYWNIEVPQDD